MVLSFIGVYTKVFYVICIYNIILTCMCGSHIHVRGMLYILIEKDIFVYKEDMRSLKVSKLITFISKWTLSLSYGFKKQTNKQNKRKKKKYKLSIS